MTAVSDETGRDWLPLKYEDGPDFCTVTFATGAAFALTVHPERMKLMEAALSASPVETITVPFNPCLAKLRDGEPFFVLIGRDKQNAIQALLRTFSEMFAVAETDRTAPENAGHVSGVHSAPDHTTMEERGR